MFCFLQFLLFTLIVFNKWKKWNSYGLDCVNLEQEHEPPNMVDYVEECVHAEFVSQS